MAPAGGLATSSAAPSGDREQGGRHDGSTWPDACRVCQSIRLRAPADVWVYRAAVASSLAVHATFMRAGRPCSAWRSLRQSRSFSSIPSSARAFPPARAASRGVMPQRVDRRIHPRFGAHPRAFPMRIGLGSEQVALRHDGPGAAVGSPPIRLTFRLSWRASGAACRAISSSSASRSREFANSVHWRRWSPCPGWPASHSCPRAAPASRRWSHPCGWPRRGVPGGLGPRCAGGTDVSPCGRAPGRHECGRQARGVRRPSRRAAHQPGHRQPGQARHSCSWLRSQAAARADPSFCRKYSMILLACSWLTSTSSGPRSPRSHSTIAGVFPAEVLPQAFIGRAVVVLKPPDEPVRVVDRAVIPNDRIVGDLVRHLESFFLNVGNVGGAIGDLDPRGHFALERVQLTEFGPARRRVADPLIGEVRHLVLGVEAVRRVELHLEPLPSGVTQRVLIPLYSGSVQ